MLLSELLLLLAPIATIKVIHTVANAMKASSDDVSGLEALVCPAKSARVMLTSNLWVEVGQWSFAQARPNKELDCAPNSNPLFYI